MWRISELPGEGMWMPRLFRERKLGLDVGILSSSLYKFEAQQGGKAIRSH